MKNNRMENEPTEHMTRQLPPRTQKRAHVLLGTLGIAIMLTLALMYAPDAERRATDPLTLEEQVIPSQGVVLPVSWGDLGARLVRAGAIDFSQLKALFRREEGFDPEYEALLLGVHEGNVRITGENAGYLLHLFWALGLANTNEILEKGEMADPKYGGAGNFASTGGWTIAEGSAMDHYSRHTLIKLTQKQQALVDTVSRGIYRPCCGNSAHFPDCNHGMAMLGLLELMASQGASEQDMWKAALAVNSYWFPDTYLTIAAYLKGRGVAWKDANPKDLLGSDYSSAKGYARIAAAVADREPQRGGGSCAVGARIADGLTG